MTLVTNDETLRFFFVITGTKRFSLGAIPCAFCLKIFSCPPPELSEDPAPFRHNAVPEPHTGPDPDPPTPCLIENSWRISRNRGSGCAAPTGDFPECSYSPTEDGGAPSEAPPEKGGSFRSGPRYHDPA
jgi:hypothetical protein